MPYITCTLYVCFDTITSQKINGFADKQNNIYPYVSQNYPSATIK